MEGPQWGRADHLAKERSRAPVKAAVIFPLPQFCHQLLEFRRALIYGQCDLILLFFLFSLCGPFASRETHGKYQPEPCPAKTRKTGVGTPVPGCTTIRAHPEALAPGGSRLQVLRGTRSSMSGSFTAMAKTRQCWACHTGKHHYSWGHVPLPQPHS